MATSIFQISFLRPNNMDLHRATYTVTGSPMERKSIISSSVSQTTMHNVRNRSQWGMFVIYMWSKQASCASVPKVLRFPHHFDHSVANIISIRCCRYQIQRICLFLWTGWGPSEKAPYLSCPTFNTTVPSSQTSQTSRIPWMSIF